jgi:CRISPR/Cas system CMR-associated protein Cmr5 small subunit
MDDELEVSTVESHVSQDIVSPPRDGLDASSPPGDYERLLANTIAEKHSLDAEALGDINNHIRALLAEGKSNAVMASEKILEARMAGIKTDFEATVLAMHTKIEEKNTRMAEHWQDQLQTLRDENSKVYVMYKEAVV